jgi:integrase
MLVARICFFPLIGGKFNLLKTLLPLVPPHRTYVEVFGGAANLYDPEDIKDVIARQDRWGIGRKSVVVKAYALFLKIQCLKWKPPKYMPVYKLPFIPTEKEIDDLIAGCGKRISTFMQLLKETAMRSGEAFSVE